MPLKHKVKEVELKNGAMGLVIDVPDASVFSYDINFKAGNSFVKSPKIQQTAHILEHLAFNGTKKYPSPEAFSQIFTENGAYNNATTSEIGISYYGGSADFEAERILSLQGQAIAEPVFNKKALDKEKLTVREELTGQLSNHSRFLWNEVMKSMGSEAFTDEQKLKTIDGITLSDIKEHYQRTHTSKNMRFIIAGNIKGQREKAMLKEIENWQVPGGELFKIKKIKLKKANGPVKIEKDQVENVYFNLIMALNRQISLREYYAMNALTHILTATFHSRIFGKARKLGLCYYLHAGRSRMPDGTSDFQFMSQVTKDNAQPLYDLIIKELNKVAKEGITEEELESVKRYSFGDYQQYGQTVSALTNFYSSYFYEEPLLELDKIGDIINSLTVAEIKEITNEFINSGVWGFGELGAVTTESTQKSYDIFANKLFNKVEKR